MSHEWKLNITCPRCRFVGDLVEVFPCCGLDDCAGLKRTLTAVREALTAARAALTCPENPAPFGHWCTACDGMVDRNAPVREQIDAALALVPNANRS